MTTQPVRPDTFLGPDGRTMMTLDDLPSGKTRWSVRRKAEVVCALMSGALGVEEALLQYSDLSSEELASWIRLHSRHGKDALRTTRVQQYR